MMDDFKKKVLKLSSEELIGMHGAIMEFLYGDSVLANMDSESYERYWKMERPEYMERLKVVENELSYRSITI